MKFPTRRLATLFIAVAMLYHAEAQKYTTRIEPLRKERWWSVCDNITPGQPLTGPFALSLPAVESRIASQGMPVMFVSNAGRYIYTSAPAEVEFDGAGFVVKSDYEKVDVRKNGRTFKEAYVMASLKNLMSLYPHPDPALYAAPVYMTDMEMGVLQGEAEMTEYAERIIREGYPAGILTICEGWRDPDGSYTFDKSYYPDPRGMIERLHARGFKVMLTVTPYLPASGRTYMRYLRDGRLLLDSEGRPVVKSTPYGYLSSLDMGKADNCAALREELKALALLGVDGFAFYCGDTSGCSAEFLDNWRSLSLDLPLYEYLVDTEESHAPCGAGSRGWSAVVEARNRLKNDASASVDWDDEKVCARMSSLMQLSAAMPVFHVPFAPWRIAGGRFAEGVKEAFRFRADNSDYIARLAREASQTSEPVLRNMEYHFNKSGFSDCDTQFLLGRNLLLVPPAETQGKRMVHIPHGVWYDAAGRRYKGPAVISVEADGSRLLVFRSATR